MLLILALPVQKPGVRYASLNSFLTLISPLFFFKYVLATIISLFPFI